MRFIEDFQEGEQITDHYLCKSKQTLKSRSGKNYLSLKIQDKTGMVDGKVWDINNSIQNFEENQYIRIEAQVTVYNNEFQLNIRKIRRSQEGEYDPVDYIPSSNKDIAALHTQLLGFIDSIKNPYIQKLLTAIFVTDAIISKELLRHSAAKTFHHSYMGGLLEHTLSVTQTCDFLAKQHPSADRDLLIAGAMLHDICKIFELSPFPINDYTDDGQLLGHIYLGAELVAKEAAKIENFPHELESLLKHIILSHHGAYEYGSPKLPHTLEAFLLHGADDIDAKAKAIEDTIAADSTQGRWVGYHRIMSRNLRKSDYEG